MLLNVQESLESDRVSEEESVDFVQESKGVPRKEARRGPCARSSGLVRPRVKIRLDNAHFFPA